MSKTLEIYNNLKKQNPNLIYLFKQGIFFIAISDDAKLLSKKLNLKLTNLNANEVKCGFPCSSFDKYSIKLKKINLTIKVIDNNILYTPDEYSINNEINSILSLIKNVDINNMSVIEVYNFIENLKSKVSKL